MIEAAETAIAAGTVARIRGMKPGITCVIYPAEAADKFGGSAYAVNGYGQYVARTCRGYKPGIRYRAFASYGAALEWAFRYARRNAR